MGERERERIGERERYMKKNVSHPVPVISKQSDKMLFIKYVQETRNKTAKN